MSARGGTPISRPECSDPAHDAQAPEGRRCVVVALDHRDTGMRYSYHVHVPDSHKTTTALIALHRHHEIRMEDLVEASP